MADDKKEESLVLNVPEVARLLKLSRATAYSLAAQGKIPTIRLGNRILVPRKALEELLASAGKPKIGKGTSVGRVESEQ